jgi:cytoskeletal protein RodZ
MSFVYYAVLIVVSLSSVVFGLEWLSEPPPVWKPVAVASVKQPAKPPVRQATSQPDVAAKAAGATGIAPTTPQVATRAEESTAGTGKAATVTDARQPVTAPAGADSTAVARVPSANDIVAPEPSAAPTAAAPQCDLQACSAAYFTFNPADCTYQPSDGPRRLCTKGTPPVASTVQAPGQETGADTAAAPPVSNKCDIDACKKAYFTFDPADCTYQPSNGPRRLCTKGTPPAPDIAQAPAPDPKPDEPQVAVNADTAPDANAGQPPVQQAGADTATAPQVSNRCDVDACKRAYFSFNPADCTYQPSDGPRRLCTKGTPPKPDAAQAPVQDAAQEENAPVEPQATASAPTAPGGSSSAVAPQVSDKCDIEACKRAYFTFNPADCTYRPSDGPRRLCTKGTPPKPDTAQAPVQDQAPAQETEPKEPDSSGSVGAAPREAPQSPSCNVQACAAAYFTFDPADCTYQPSNGPRRLCTK